MEARKFIWFIIFQLSTTWVVGQTNSKPETFTSANAKELNYLGRVARQADSVIFAWSGTGLAFASEAENLSFLLSDHSMGKDDYGRQIQGRYAVLVNNNVYAVLEGKKGKERYSLYGLPSGKKEIKLLRLNEAMVSFTVFKGIYADRPLTEAKKENTLKLEFIGNSITTGYGNMPDSIPCHFSPKTQNFLQSYAYLLADKLKADISTVAWSGRGLARNYDKTETGVLPELYAYAVPYQQKIEWELNSWQPDVVLIHLGTNDFAHEIPVEDLWVKRYLNFLDEIYAHYPRSRFLLLGGPTLTDRPSYPAYSTLKSYLNTIKEQAAARGLDVEAYVMPHFEGAGGGCDAHPDEEAHEKMAQELRQKMEAYWPELFD
jgi:lysophospholipase L1-like esterase